MRFHPGNVRISLTGQGLTIIDHLSPVLMARRRHNERRAAQVILPSREAARRGLLLSGSGFFNSCAKAKTKMRAFSKIAQRLRKILGVFPKASKSQRVNAFESRADAFGEFPRFLPRRRGLRMQRLGTGSATPMANSRVFAMPSSGIECEVPSAA